MALRWNSKPELQPQGLLAPEIPVTIAQRRARDCDTLVAAVIQFGAWCIDEAWLVPAEVTRDVWLIHGPSFYIGQVDNGGHGQFAGNSGMKPEMLDHLEDGLDALGLHDLLAIFRRFRHALDGDPALKRAVMAAGGFGKAPGVIEEVDEAFFRSPERGRFHERATRWLKDAPSVVALTPREIRKRQDAIVAANAMLDRRRAAASRGTLRERLTGLVLRQWDRTGIRRPGEDWYDQLRRRVAEEPHWTIEVSRVERRLSELYGEAVIEGDEATLDEVFAAYRDLHARHRLDTLSRWPSDIRGYAYRLHNAGEKLARADLLEQAADAWGRAISAGPPAHDHDPGAPWRGLGQSLVMLARLDPQFVPGLREAPDMFERALALDSEKQGNFHARVRDLLGRAEAHLLLAAGDAARRHLDAARAALDQARPLLRSGQRDQWRAVHAELLTLLPAQEVRAHGRRRAICGLDLAIARELEDEGGHRFNPTRLMRLRSLRAALAVAA